MRPSSLCAVCAISLAGAIDAQRIPTVDSAGHSAGAAVFTTGTDGVAQPALDPRTYRPLPMPVYRHVPLPDGFVERPVTFDVATGRETLDVPPLGPVLPRDQVEGWRAGPEELSPAAWGNLSVITSQAFPWSAQCRVFFTQGGNNFVCSGTLVDQRNVITAGHCVHAGPSGTWSTNVVVRPAWDGDDDAFGSANGTVLASWTTWTVSGSFDGDIGWIRLDRPVGALTGWLGYGYNTSNAFYSSTTFNMAGYPGNRTCWPSAPNALHYGFGTYDQVFTRSMRANTPWTCTIGGMSGTGVYLIDASSNRIVHGVVSNETVTFADMGHTRMIQAYFEYMRDTFFPAAYTAALDLTPLDTNASATVTAGSAPALLNYVVANCSLADPGSASYSVSVYLSTNNVISSGDTLLQTHTFTWDFAPRSAVRVNVTSPPVIPSSTPAGAYYLGVILNIADANTANNAITGWDAAPITVSNTLNTLRVRSTNPATGVSISVGTPDRNGNSNGTTAFDREYWGSTNVSLTAPATSTSGPFYRWVINGVPRAEGSRVQTVNLTSTQTATAEFYRNVTGTYTSFGRGCPAPRPSLLGSGVPQVGGTFTANLSVAPANAAGVFYLGASRTLYNGFPLPLLLDVVGMTGCYLDVSVDIGIPFRTNAAGQATLSIPIANQLELVTGHWYLQAAVLDLSVPWPTKIDHSLGLDAMIGGPIFP